MYKVNPYSPRIRLIGNDGSVSEYACWKEFLEASDYWFLSGHLVNKFNDPRDKVTIEWYFADLIKKLPRRIHYIVRDEFGSVFGRDEVLEAVADRTKSLNHRKYSWFYNRYNFIYRQTPVPYTRKIRRHKGTFYRRPRTTQEKRWGHIDKEFIRGKRHSRYLPDAWEDMPRADIRIKKSWKKYRKKQYKEKIE